MALLETEKIRLANLADLVAQRPTLQGFVQQGDINAINRYLKTFQNTVDLDILILSEKSGQALASGGNFSPSTTPPFLQDAVYQLITGTRSQLALLVSRPIPVEADQEIYVTVGIILIEDYVKKLASQTGFEHSFLLNEEKISTTLSDLHLTVIGVDVAKQATISGITETAHLEFQDSHYYGALIPLQDANNKVVALVEVCLPIENLLAANQNTLLVLVLSTLLVAISASGLAGYFAQRLTVPLNNLTDAAVKICQGDFDSPIPVPDSPSEIVTLAAAFEKSRKTTLLALENLSRAKAWSETLIQSVVEGIVTVDDRGMITSFNQGAEQISGWNRNEVVGKSINQIFPLAEDNNDFMQHVSLSGDIEHVTVKTYKGFYGVTKIHIFC